MLFHLLSLSLPKKRPKQFIQPPPNVCPIIAAKQASKHEDNDERRKKLSINIVAAEIPEKS